VESTAAAAAAAAAACDGRGGGGGEEEVVDLERTDGHDARRRNNITGKWSDNLRFHSFFRCCHRWLLNVQ
jgi:hypothetical protein